jgi:hypothetical protein
MGRKAEKCWVLLKKRSERERGRKRKKKDLGHFSGQGVSCEH